MPESLAFTGGPRCGACAGPAVVQWQRRPTAEELAGLVAAEQARRAEAMARAGRGRGAPVFGALPTAGDVRIAVFGCAEHAIHLEAAAQVHAASCSAPHPDHLPACDCSPEPMPAPEPRGIPMTTLSTGWVVPASTT